MQVVVLAGGVGSRLRPWTETIPKPLLPMLDRTLLEQVIYSIPSDLIDEVIVAGGYKVDMIKSYFDSIECDFEVSIVNEKEPLGTGGALANCGDLVSGTFACFNGDIISSLDVKDLLSLHNKNGGIGTLGLWEVEDPTRYGIVGLDNNNKVTKFMEKPKPEQVFSNLINAGSYVFEDTIFDYLPKGKHSLERDVFPKLTKSKSLNGLKFDGYFIDAGTQQSWCDAVSRCVMESRFNRGSIHSKSWIEDSEVKISSANLQHSMVCSSTDIGNSSIKQSTILSKSKVGDKSVIVSSLIGKDCIIGDYCELTNTIVAHGSNIPNNTKIIDGVWLNE